MHMVVRRGLSFDRWHAAHLIHQHGGWYKNTTSSDKVTYLGPVWTKHQYQPSTQILRRTKSVPTELCVCHATLTSLFSKIQVPTIGYVIFRTSLKKLCHNSFSDPSQIRPGQILRFMPQLLLRFRGISNSWRVGCSYILKIGFELMPAWTACHTITRSPPKNSGIISIFDRLHHCFV